MDTSLERLSESNLITALDMCDRFVSPGLYTPESLAATAAESMHDFYLVKAINIASVPGFRYELIAALCGPEEEIGLFRSTGLEPSCRGTGLSDDLMKLFQTRYQEYGVSLILVPAWRQGSFVPAEKLLLRSGFHYFCDLIRPWADSPELQCTYCGQERCICDAVVYYSRTGP